MTNTAVDRTIGLHDQIIRQKELQALVPYSGMHLWRLEKVGRFPRRIKLGPNRVGWSLNEVNAWLEARKAERGLSMPA